MKKVKRTKFVKQIIFIILIVLMLYNFIVPNYSYAAGGDLLEPVSQFLCFLPDTVIGYLQNMLVSPEEIKTSGENYRIKYAPAIIFAGEVPAFDINFIHPKEDKVVDETKNKIYIDTITDGDIGAVFSRLKNNKIDSSNTELNWSHNLGRMMDEVNTNYYYNVREYNIYFNDSVNFDYDDWLEQMNDYDEFMSYWKGCYVWISENTIYLSVFNHIVYLIVDSMEYSVYSTTLTDSELQMFESMVQTTNYSKTYKSTASILQNSVATWYNALRRIALVGLLSVLVYIGIRILLTSTSAKDKAKYKSMLKDWLIALCILFTLHYIMNITITVVNSITEVIKASAIGANGEDVLMSTIRNEIARGSDWGEVIVHVVLYFVLAIYTIIFSIQYIRRTIYLAFLTMIAPLITLTYPLDKIKDKKSQAFDTWFKDYIFFTLLQVVHLLVYYVLVGSSINLANEGEWVFAIVAIGFLTKAEKIVKKMFGFEKSKSMGALAAGATGALVMDAINKVKAGKGGKSKTSSNSSSTKSANANPMNNVRTAQNNPLASLQGGMPGAPAGMGATTGGPVTGTPASGGNIPVAGEKPKRNIANGAKALVGRYWRPVLGGVAKGTLGVLAGGAGAALGFASGVAQGDLGKAVGGAFAGGTAGFNLGKAGVDLASNTVTGIGNLAQNVKDTFNEGAQEDDS